MSQFSTDFQFMVYAAMVICAVMICAGILLKPKKEEVKNRDIRTQGFYLNHMRKSLEDYANTWDIFRNKYQKEEHINSHYIEPYLQPLRQLQQELLRLNDLQNRFKKGEDLQPKEINYTIQKVTGSLTNKLIILPPDSKVKLYELYKALSDETLTSKELQQIIELIRKVPIENLEIQDVL